MHIALKTILRILQIIVPDDRSDSTAIKRQLRFCEIFPRKRSSQIRKCGLRFGSFRRRSRRQQKRKMRIFAKKRKNRPPSQEAGSNNRFRFTRRDLGNDALLCLFVKEVDTVGINRQTDNLAYAGL